MPCGVWQVVVGTGVCLLAPCRLAGAEARPAAGGASPPTAGTRVPRPGAIRFGNTASEKSHSLTSSDAVTLRGALGEPCRHVGPNGHLTFRMTCDPDEQNYLTVKLWGSDTGSGQLYLYDGEDRVGGYQKHQPELDLLGGDPAFPGRFFYSTYMIPDAMTEDRRDVTLRIGSTGQPTPYSRQRKEAEQRDLSRSVYAAYVHTNAFFTPSAGGKSGQAPQAGPPLAHPDGLSSVEHLHRQLDLAVERLLRWQWIGDDWDAWVAEGKAPGGLTGAIVTRGAKDTRWTPEEWRRQAARRMGGNRVCLLVPEIYARAYHAGWSRYHGRKELVERVIKALDYFRVAQGQNGGFDDIWAHEWVGGPVRRRAGNCLEGFGHMGLGAAFLELKGEIETGPYLDERVEDDDDPATPQVPRRAAWTDLFRCSRDYLTTVRGHAPNQDMANQVAAYLANQCLRVLAPDQAWAEDRIRPLVYSACGFEPDIYGGRWISAKGLSCEPNGTSNGGYCGNYGDLSDPLFRLAHRTRDERIERRALQFSHTLAKFRYPSLDAAHRPVLRREGVITWRNNRTPGKIDSGGDPYAAAVLRDPLNVRGLQLAVANGDFFRVDLDRYWAHLQAVTAMLMRQVDSIEQALALPPSAARLPFEPGQPDFAWADEQAGTVVVRRGDERLLMSLNWRHGYRNRTRSPENAVANDIARVHHTTPTIERIANVRMESRDGFGGLYVCRYGPYLIGMNASAGKTYELGVPAEWSGARELVSGATLSAGAQVPLQAQCTAVLKATRYTGEADAP